MSWGMRKWITINISSGAALLSIWWNLYYPATQFTWAKFAETGRSGNWWILLIDHQTPKTSCAIVHWVKRRQSCHLVLSRHRQRFCGIWYSWRFVNRGPLETPVRLRYWSLGETSKFLALKHLQIINVNFNRWTHTSGRARRCPSCWEDCRRRLLMRFDLWSLWHLNFDLELYSELHSDRRLIIIS